MSGSSKLSRSTRGVNATAAEINAAVAGQGLTAAEVAVLDGVTPGTVTASKALVVNATKQLASLGDLTIADGSNIIVATTTGTVIGTSTTQKLAFFNATPVAQPSAYTQTYSTADKTHANPTATSVTTTSSTSTSPFGYTQAQADAIVTAINALIVDVADVKALANSIIDDLQALGLVG